MMRPGILLAVLLTAACLAWGIPGIRAHLDRSAQPSQPAVDDDPLDAVDARIIAFFDAISRSEFDRGLQTFLERSPLTKDPKQVQQLQDSIRREVAKYGAFRSAEQLLLDRRGQSLIRGTYLYKCADFPIVWDFVLYQPDADDVWVVIAIKFHVDYDKL